MTDSGLEKRKKIADTPSPRFSDDYGRAPPPRLASESGTPEESDSETDSVSDDHTDDEDEEMMDSDFSEDSEDSDFEWDGDLLSTIFTRERKPRSSGQDPLHLHHRSQKEDREQMIQRLASFVMDEGDMDGSRLLSPLEFQRVIKRVPEFMGRFRFSSGRFV